MHLPAATCREHYLANGCGRSAPGAVGAPPESGSVGAPINFLELSGTGISEVVKRTTAMRCGVTGRAACSRTAPATPASGEQLSLLPRTMIGR